MTRRLIYVRLLNKDPSWNPYVSTKDVPRQKWLEKQKGKKENGHEKDADNGVVSLGDSVRRVFHGLAKSVLQN
ncbi:MAG: hypothetical protein WCO30_01545 [bacterium]